VTPATLLRLPAAVPSDSKAKRVYVVDDAEKDIVAGKRSWAAKARSNLQRFNRVWERDGREGPEKNHDGSQHPQADPRHRRRRHAWRAPANLVERLMAKSRACATSKYSGERPVCGGAGV